MRKALAGRAMDVAIVVVAVATLAELLTDGRPVPALVSAVCGLVLLARRRAPAIAIVAAFAGQLALTALRFGASGFLLKDVRSGELVEAVRTVAAGQSLLSPSITRRLIERFVRAGPGPGPPPAVTGLTPREREVLLLIAEGLSNAEIASRLYPSEATIKTHVNRLLSKLGLRDRVQAVVLAYETGLIKPGHRAS